MKQTQYWNTARDVDVLIITPNKQDGAKDLLLLEQLAALINEGLTDTEVSGIIYQASNGRSQMDYKGMHEELKTHGRITELMMNIHAIQQQNKPMVAIIDGTCNSVQLSASLWATSRIATVNSSMSFPESRFGLYPGFGAYPLLLRLVEAEKAVEILKKGTVTNAQEAKEIGMIDGIAQDANEALSLAKSCLTNPPHPPRRLLSADQKDKIEDLFNEMNATIALIKRPIDLTLPILMASKGNDLKYAIMAEAEFYPASWEISNAVTMLRSLHYGVIKAKSAKIGEAKQGLEKIGILGAGMMGSGIAYEAARAGISVVLKDVTLPQAEKGKSYSARVADKLIQRGRISEEKKQTILDLIKPTADTKDLAHSDLIIEAVFEDKNLKAEITQESLAYLKDDGIFASNTTSLPITELAAVSSKPDRFIGMHFFSPVDRMPLVEIIRGKQTSDETVAKALDVARQLGKTPIVVHDGPAFFTSRIFFNYLLEAITMLSEGIPASDIEEAAAYAGFGVGPLAVLDEISLELMLHVYDQLPELHASQHRAYNYLKTLVEQGRNGRKTGKGFYDYDAATRSKSIWQDPTLSQKEIDDENRMTLQKRLLNVMALDSYRCLADGVLSRPIDGDIGSILGVGYPPQTGGVFGHIDQVGIQTFVEECQSFATHGEQWQIPDTLLGFAATNFKFYRDFESNWTSQS